MGIRQIKGREVVDAFSHDPSSVTGHLRNMKGWQAVEEIHRRLSSQREILQGFVAGLSNTSASPVLPEKGIYEDAIAKLNDLLDELQSRRDSGMARFKQANELLSKVKRVRDELKPEFDETSRHTSANYTEVSFYPSLYLHIYV